MVMIIVMIVYCVLHLHMKFSHRGKKKLSAIMRTSIGGDLYRSVYTHAHTVDIG